MRISDWSSDVCSSDLVETYFSLSCQNCPDVVQALNLAAVLNPNIHHVAIDGALFQDEVEAREVMSVPSVFLNGEPFDQGRMTLEQIVARLDTGAAAREAEAIDEIGIAHCRTPITNAQPVRRLLLEK